MKEKAIAKLKEWFGNSGFDYKIIKLTDDECIFTTISDDCEEDIVSLYRVFKLGDGLEISKDYEQLINSNVSILSTISEIIKVYERVSK